MFDAIIMAETFTDELVFVVLESCVSHEWRWKA
jgi:hypothetical protein